MKTITLTIFSLVLFACVVEATPPPPPGFCDAVPNTDCSDEWACSPDTDPVEQGVASTCRLNGWYNADEREWCCF